MSRFVMTLQPLPGTDGIKALRALLKRALRAYGLRCVTLYETQDEIHAPTVPPAARDSAWRLNRTETEPRTDRK
jgi:hypothetical protein